MNAIKAGAIPNPGSDGVDDPSPGVVADDRVAPVVPVGVDGGHVAVGVVAVSAVAVGLADPVGASVAVEPAVGDRVGVSVVFSTVGEGVAVGEAVGDA